MKIRPLTQGDKDSIATMARALAGRALSAGESQASAANAQHATDQIAEFDRRLDAMNREMNARLTTMTHAIEIIQRKIAGLAGDFQGVRLALADIETKVAQEHEKILESVDILVNGLTVELTGTVDRLSLVAADTATAQHELVILTRQVAAATALPEPPVPAPDATSV
jgi:chromosome segregation ATPase